MAKKIETYQAEDGSIHQSLYAAEQHEKSLKFIAWCVEFFDNPHADRHSGKDIAEKILRHWSVPMSKTEADSKTRVV